MRLINLGREIRVVMAVSMLGLTGCQNGNLFGKLHSPGSSGDSATLVAEGNQALRNQDYSSALSTFQKVLDGDPRNSQALYGAATAEVGLSGLNLGQLLTNILNKDGSLSSSSLGDAIVQNSHGIGQADVAATNSILAGISLAAQSNYFKDAKKNLYSIITGQTDGTIAASDFSSLVDFAIVALIEGVQLLLNSGVADVINDSGTLKVVTKVSAASFCSAPANAAVIDAAGEDLAMSYAALNKAVSVSGASSGVVSRFNGELYSVVKQALDGNGVSDLDPACVAVLAADGITATTFTTKYTF